MNKILKCSVMNFIRSFSNKMGMVISFVMIPLIVLVSFYMNSRDQDPMNIAIIGDAPQFTSYLEKNGISYDIMDKEPDKFLMYKRIYSGAVLTENGQAISAISYEGEIVQNDLEKIIEHNYTPEKAEKSFTKSFYVNLCILLIQAVLNMKLFINDRRNNIKDRLQIMGVSRTEYMASYLIFNWASLFIPYSLSNIVCSAIFLKTSFIGCIRILLICFVVSGLFSAIALLICSAVTDNASAIMTGNLIACFSALLSGMFGGWSNRITQTIGNCMPQSISYTWAEKVFSGGSLLNTSSILITILFTVIFLSALILYRRNDQKN